MPREEAELRKDNVETPMKGNWDRLYLLPGTTQVDTRHMDMLVHAVLAVRELSSMVVIPVANLACHRGMRLSS